jgi:hypothetical protein
MALFKELGSEVDKCDDLGQKTYITLTLSFFLCLRVMAMMTF